MDKNISVRIGTISSTGAFAILKTSNIFTSVYGTSAAVLAQIPAGEEFAL